MFHRLFSKSKGAPRRSRRPFAAKLCVEELEARRVLSADVAGLAVEIAAETGPPEVAIENTRHAAELTGSVDLKNPDSPAQIGLLLPAVQKVRDAASRSDPPTMDPPCTVPPLGDDLPAVDNVERAGEHTAAADLKSPDTPAPLGLLLPAIQKVREAASRPPGAADPSTDPPTRDDPPAADNVRHAAELTGAVDLKNPDAPARIGLLLPAVQKVRAAS